MKDFILKDIYESNHEVIEYVWKNGSKVHDGKDILREILNVSISVDNPNLPRWDDIDNKYKDKITWMRKNFFEDKPVLNWGYSYGQRLCKYMGVNQIEEIYHKLLKNPDSKSATISLMYPPEDVKHSPCVNVMDFKIRNNTLMMNVFMRSQDAGNKMFADLFCYTEILESIKERLSLKYSKLNVYIMSLHIYQKDFMEEESNGGINQ